MALDIATVRATVSTDPLRTIAVHALDLKLVSAWNWFELMHLGIESARLYRRVEQWFGDQVSVDGGCIDTVHVSAHQDNVRVHLRCALFFDMANIRVQGE